MAKTLSKDHRRRVEELVASGLMPIHLRHRLLAEGITVSLKAISEYRRKAGIAQRFRSVMWSGRDNITCGDCTETYPKEDFCRGEGRYVSSCKACRSKTNRDSLNGSLRALVNYARARSKERFLAFNLDLMFVLDLWKKQEGLDYYTGEAMTYGERSRSTRATFHGPSKSSVSIDRVEPALGYIRMNVVLCRHDTNAAKNEADLEKLRAIVNGIERFYAETLTGTEDRDAMLNTKYALIQSARR